jgi:methylated-DNA-[protein]-cysteine S-methyltransferase
METLYYASMKCPVGNLTLFASEKGLFTLFLPVKGREITEALLRKKLPKIRFVRDDGRLREPVRQIEEYFRGKRTAFSVPLDLRGTDFQKKVWKAISGVPYGKTESYGGIAKRIRNSSATRAVGAACGANPVPILIPCHRIVGKNGSLTGFGGGLGMKEKLLELETNNL